MNKHLLRLARLSLCLAAPLALTSCVRTRTVYSKCACIANLKLIAGAKAEWALENKKSDTDTPTDADLFGQGKPIGVKPTCPQGGTYQLRAVGENPVCSIGGENHILR
jgi:hypothetical protein